jgi:hypothetical protein
MKFNPSKLLIECLGTACIWAAMVDDEVDKVSHLSRSSHSSILLITKAGKVSLSIDTFPPHISTMHNHAVTYSRDDHQAQTAAFRFHQIGPIEGSGYHGSHLYNGYSSRRVQAGPQELEYAPPIREEEKQETRQGHMHRAHQLWEGRSIHQLRRGHRTHKPQVHRTRPVMKVEVLFVCFVPMEIKKYSAPSIICKNI